MADPKGWNSRGYLPHFDSPETVQFVTFRLADSLPRAVADSLTGRWGIHAELDEQPDRSLGECWLKRPEIAELVEGAFLYFDASRYRLLAWCVMPNHVHVVFEPIGDNQLGAVVQTWKSFTAHRANRLLARQGAFWHNDYFDRFMRDEAHLDRTIHYVEENPVKVGLVAAAAEWRWSSARRKA
jgi:putative transposase